LERKKYRRGIFLGEICSALGKKFDLFSGPSNIGRENPDLDQNIFLKI